MLPGGKSILPLQTGAGGGGDGGILHHQLLPVPGHWTVAPAVLDAHLHWLSPHSPFHHLLHKSSAADLELLTLNWLLLYINGFFGGGGVPFFFFFATGTVPAEGNLMSSLYSFVVFVLVRAAFEAPTRAGCFLAYATLQFVHSNWNVLPRVLPSQKPQLKTLNALDHICTCFFKAPNISSYKQQILHIYILLYSTSINTNIYMYMVKCLYSVFAFLPILQCLCIHTVYISIYSIY